MWLHSPCITLWSSLPASVFTASQIFVVCYHAPFGCLPSLDTFTSQTHPSSPLTIVNVPFFFFCYFFPFSSPSPLHVARPDVSSWLNHSHLGFLWLHLHPPGVCSSQSSSWCTFGPTWIKVPPWAATRWISMFFFLWSFLLMSWKVSSGVSTSRRFGKVFPKILGVKLLHWFHQLILPPPKMPVHFQFLCAESVFFLLKEENLKPALQRITGLWFPLWGGACSPALVYSKYKGKKGGKIKIFVIFML